MNGTELPDIRALPCGFGKVDDATPTLKRKRRLQRGERAARRASDGSVARGTGGGRSPFAATRTPLGSGDFLAELRREMRRAERCGGVLSLAIYNLTDEHDGAASAEHFVARVCEQKREIDTVGWLGPCTVAVLCPDTDESGVKGFAQKIAAIEGCRAEPPRSATYPDALFDELLHASPPSPCCVAFLESDAARPAAGEPYRLKRAIDIAGALLGLLLSAPLMAVVALCIAASSPGPIIFKQTRLGRGGKPFTFYKFRSMRADAGEGPHKEFVAKLIEGLPTGTPGASAAPFKLQADPRITRIGRFIRKTSVDELPQFFNVLKGDMSLVGPRPPIPYEATHYEAWHLRRLLSITPGITGLWQVHGRSKVSFDEMVRMDLRYQRECSLGLDLQILLRTMLVVVRCEGAA